MLYNCIAMGHMLHKASLRINCIALIFEFDTGRSKYYCITSRIIVTVSPILSLLLDNMCELSLLRTA